MKKTRHILKVAGVLSLACAFLVGPMVPSAQAGLFGGGGISIPSPSAIAGELENRYHINVGSMQDQSETFNVAGQKKTVPEVMLSFSPSDPKPGTKITAIAMPSFFSNDASQLYFSWYLKRKGCDADSSPSSAVRAACDNDDNGRIDVNDWKIEAMRALATDGFDNFTTSYESGDDTDNDGYRARFGGDNKVGTTSNYCAIHDASSGTVYEVVKNISDMDGVCGSGLTAVCVDTSTGASVTPGSVSGGFSGDVSGSAFTPASGESAYTITGHPRCSSLTATCTTGSLRCLADPKGIPEFGSAPIATACTGDDSTPESACTHLFPRVSGFTSGDGSFGVNEEKFWHTNPQDPDTAGNGNKDEANITGLGQGNFTWNYDSGDKVGVVVEGTSMLVTKHDNASAYTMWAFSKNNCPSSIATETGAYSQSIRGYSVSFPAVVVDLDDCLERNLVDPTEGGQPNRIDVSVSADPENPINDESGDGTGDIVTAYASVANGSQLKGQFFDWTVSIANNIQFDNSGSGRRSNDVTDELKGEKLLNLTRGSGLSEISLPMNMPSAWESGLSLADYVNNDGIGYMKFAVTVSENFATNVARKGRGDVVVKFQTIEDRIGAYRVTASQESLKLSFQNGDAICDENLSGRMVCPVVKNEIVGLKISSSGFTNYRWMVNGSPLLCSKAFSDQCSDDVSTNVVFLPIFGETDDTFTVSVDATDVVSGKSATLSRIFRIVNPTVEIVPADTNSTWQKFLGQYRDASGTLYSDLSRNIFQSFSGGKIRLKSSFVPPFLASEAFGVWTINGETVAENASGEIDFPILVATGSIYNVSFQASTIQSAGIRQALQKHWNISVFDSGEENFSKSIQVEIVGGEDTGEVTTGFLPGSKSFAALASYIPASVLFTIKAFFSMALILILSGFMMVLASESSLRRIRE